jgi:hypothetical protein
MGNWTYCFGHVIVFLFLCFVWLTGSNPPNDFRWLPDHCNNFLHFTTHNLKMEKLSRIIFKILASRSRSESEPKTKEDGRVMGGLVFSTTVFLTINRSGQDRVIIAQQYHIPGSFFLKYIHYLVSRYVIIKSFWGAQSSKTWTTLPVCCLSTGGEVP